MNVDALSIKDKVQRHLTDIFDKVVVDSDGDFSFRIGSTQMWVAVAPVEQTKQRAGYVAVRVFANTNNRVPPSPELYICFSAMANTADAIDDQIKSRFGGVLYHEGSK